MVAVPVDGGVLRLALSSAWLLTSAFLVFFMQAGFALLEAGTVRPKNTKNILLKNVIDACLATLAWWALGAAFAGGTCADAGANAFIGTRGFFLADAGPVGLESETLATWLFGYAFCATASTIVSGAVAERLQLRAYIIYTLATVFFIYPIVAHWVWSQTGWLSARRLDCGAGVGEPTALFAPAAMGLLDFAGSGVVHMVGGAMGLVGAAVTGPRLGRFPEGAPRGVVARFETASATQQVLGVLILWLGWFGFNSGSTGCMYGCMGAAALAAVNTTIAISAGSVSCLALAVTLGMPGDLSVLLNGILAGAVSITAGCALVEPYGAFVIGAVGACVYTGAAALLRHLRVDDVVEAVPVHLFCGAWGLVSVGFFAVESDVAAVYGYANDWGVFYGGSGAQLGVQLLGAAAIFAWSAAWGLLVFGGLKLAGALRVSREDEIAGLDAAQGLGHGSFLGFLRARRGGKGGGGGGGGGGDDDDAYAL
jgi:Amt family ammonium transporter